MADPPPETETTTLSRADLDHLRFDWSDVAALDRVPLRRRKAGRSSSSAKVKLYRQRRRMGVVVLRVVIPENAIAEYLIETGRLSAAETTDRRRVERAVAEILIELADRWPPHKL
jgi:hypothetical protein